MDDDCILAGPAVRRFASLSRPGLTHLVQRLDDGRLVCTCEGFQYRATCRHVDLTCAGCLGGKLADEDLCSTCRAVAAKRVRTARGQRSAPAWIAGRGEPRGAVPPGPGARSLGESSAG